eukprot:1591903-Alexandrium_andersonii.AAC.1
MTGMNVPRSGTGMVQADVFSAAAYFRLYTDFVDLMFVGPLQQHVDKIRTQAAGVCLFGWCGDADVNGRCAHGVHPSDGFQAFRW